jgi:Flp pilus assembly protein TadD
MPKSHYLTTLRFTSVAFLSLMFVVVALHTGVKAQQSTASEERENGIKLYKQGEIKAAINVLSLAVKNDKEDGEAWYYLGLSHVRQDDLKSARNSFDAGPAHFFLQLYGPLPHLNTEHQISRSY